MKFISRNLSFLALTVLALSIGAAAVTTYGQEATKEKIKGCAIAFILI